MEFVFKKKYDVAVVGAGIAGVAAAVAAARRGRKVALIEKQTLIGGLATSGLIYIYLPLCDGFGTQVSGGLCEEFIRSCTEFGPFELPEKWGGTGKRCRKERQRFEIEFSPAGFTLTLDEYLQKHNVDLWLESQVCAVQCDNSRITAIEVENISGRGIVEADCFVDASGAALLIQRAGGRVIHDINHHIVWLIETSSTGNKRYPLTDSMHVATASFGVPDFAPGEACDGKRVTDFTRAAWAGLRERYRNTYSIYGEKPEANYPVHLPAMAQFRKIAGIVGKTMLNSGDNQKRFDDSIGLVADWRRSGPVWETPFGALVPEKVDGVFAAGRCIAAADDAWEVYRVIPAAAVTGEAAGIAAAIASEKGCSAHEVKAEDVRSALRDCGIKLHLDEVGLAYGDTTDTSAPVRSED